MTLDVLDDAFPAILALLVHAALVLAGAPLLTGLLRCGAAWLRGAGAASPLQPYRDMLRLLRKRPVVGVAASAVFRLVPVCVLAPTVVAALLVPGFALGMATAPLSDLLLIGGLLLLARTALALGGWDGGTAPGGTEASRTMARVTQPALVLAVFVLAVGGGTTNLDHLAALLQEAGRGQVAASYTAIWTAILALALVLLLETGQLGTVAPPVPVLVGGSLLPGAAGLLREHSGWHLAVLEYAASLRLAVWLCLIGTLAMPAGLAVADGGALAWGGGFLAWGGKLGAMLAALAAQEAYAPRLRWPATQAVVGAATLLGVLAAVLLLVAQRSA